MVCIVYNQSRLTFIYIRMVAVQTGQRKLMIYCSEQYLLSKSIRLQSAA